MILIYYENQKRPPLLAFAQRPLSTRIFPTRSIYTGSPRYLPPPFLPPTLLLPHTLPFLPLAPPFLTLAPCEACDICHR